jgi:hypothetical protein
LPIYNEMVPNVIDFYQTQYATYFRLRKYM